MSITRVQYAKNASTASVTTLSATLAATGAGSLLVAVVAVGSTASNGTCPTPSGWTLAAGPVSTNSGAVADVNLYIFFKVDTAGGTSSVTFTDTVSSGITIEVWEFSASGGWPASPLGVTASSANQASTTAPATGTTTTTAQGEELWIGGLSTHVSQTETFSAPTGGFTLEASASATGGFFNPQTAALYQIVAVTGAAATGATVNHASVFAGAVATFKDTVGGTVNGTATMEADSGASESVLVSAPATPISASATSESALIGAPASMLASSEASVLARVASAPADLSAQSAASEAARITAPALFESTSAASIQASSPVLMESDSAGSSAAWVSASAPLAAASAAGAASATLVSATLVSEANAALAEVAAILASAALASVTSAQVAGASVAPAPPPTGVRVMLSTSGPSGPIGVSAAASGPTNQPASVTVAVAVAASGISVRGSE